jgi:argininosuccinate lyase
MSRFDAQPAPELVESAYWYETSDALLLHHDLNLADLAHLLHLQEQQLIPPNIAQALVQLVLQLDGELQFPYEPAQGDAFTNREHWLQGRAPDAVGYYSTGRARREATTIAFRLVVRRELLRLMRALVELEETLLELAARHVATIMPDYTYLQQAQPTTFAHYLLAFLFPLQRDNIRLQQTFALVNQSPAGIGSTNGSRLPLRREDLALALGFDGVITNTRDAMWQVDAPIQALNAVTTLMLNLGRLAEDLQIFNTVEFGFIELSNSFARASVIMPQKKNPYPLAFVRGAAGELIGRMTEMYVIARTPSAQVDNRIFAHGGVPRALDLTTRCVRLMNGVCGTIQVHTETMRHRVQQGFTHAMDLAEVLSQECALDYRSAHQIVAQVVGELRKGPSQGEITAQKLDAAAEGIIGRPLNLAPQRLAAALDPEQSILARDGVGGAAPARVQEMIEECRDQLNRERVWLDDKAARIEQAESNLLKKARVFSGQPEI